MTSNLTSKLTNAHAKMYKFGADTAASKTSVVESSHYENL